MPQLTHRAALLVVCCVLAAGLYVGPLPAQDAGGASVRPDAAVALISATAGSGTCSGAGRLTCDLPPAGADPKALCAQLTACLENRRFTEGVIKRLILCEPLASKTKLGDVRVQALAAVSAIVEDGEERQHHAAYLIGGIGRGWCVLDELLDPLWSPNGCSATFHIGTRRGAGEQPWQATVASQRTCYDTRDQEELARGESNVRSVTCARARYAVAEGKARRVEWSERDGPCGLD